MKEIANEILSVNNTEGNKVAILVIDEDREATGDAESYDQLISRKQERVIEFANTHNLPMWFVYGETPTRKLLMNKATNKELVSEFHKFHTSAFLVHPHEGVEYPLDNQLKDAGITHLVILGHHMEACVKETAMSALKLGYEVITSMDTLRQNHLFFYDQCSWKNVEGISFYESLDAEVKHLRDESVAAPSSSLWDQPMPVGEAYEDNLDYNEEITFIEFGFDSNGNIAEAQQSSASSEKPRSQNAYEQLRQLLESELFIEPGSKLKEQVYPNLVHLLNAIKDNADFITIKEIANQGIERNSTIKEKNVSSDSEHLSNRLTIFQTILNANTLEEALDSIHQKYPQDRQTQDNESTINTTLK
ncbi:isochorismatase family protein [Legionella quateirensis]|nr:isochorismatase family protein [Legionella quateirensis]